MSVLDPEQVRSDSPVRSLGAAGLLFLATFLAYLPLQRAGFIWDDDVYVEQNETLRSLTGLRQIWLSPRSIPQYYPLVHTSFWLQFHLWELWATGFHLVNVFFHAANSCLVWLILQRLRIRGAWLASLIFALHPVQVESVAWITEHKNVLSGFFYLAAMWTAVRFLRLDVVAETGPENSSATSNDRTHPSTTSSAPVGSYILATIFFIAALLCKTVTCSLPAALLLLIYWRRGHITRRELLLLMPWFLVGIGFGWLTTWMEAHHVGATGREFPWTFTDRLLIAGRALWFYASKLFFPTQLTFMYEQWKIDPRVWWQWMYVISAGTLPLLLWINRFRLGRGPLVAVLFFGGTLFPALGFINVYPMRYTFVADHFQYLASLGLIVLFSAGLNRLFSPSTGLTPEAGRRPVPVAWISVQTAIALVLGGLTAKQACIYENLEVLWKDTLAKNPSSWMAHNNLGSVYLHRGAPAAALAEYEAAIRYKPDNPEALNNVGFLYSDAGDSKRAESALRKALELTPGDELVWFNLGEELSRQNRLSEALEAYQHAEMINPVQAINSFKVGITWFNLGKLSEARSALERSAHNDPEFAHGRGNLGHVLLRLGKPAEALQQFNLALEKSSRRGDTESPGRKRSMTPNDDSSSKSFENVVRTLRAAALKELHRNAEAREEYQAVLKTLAADDPLAAEIRQALQLLAPSTGRDKTIPSP